MGFFTAYFDSAGHPADQPFVNVSGYVANYTQWRWFNRMWEKEHEVFKANLPFHMTDFMARKYGKRDDYKQMPEEDAAKFVLNLATLQQALTLFGVTCIVKMSDYTSVNTVLDLRKVVPPYALGARLCIARLHQWQEQYRIAEPVECIFEDGDFERGKFIDLMRVEGLPAPIFKDKKDFPGLQAADYLAWEMNNQLKAELRDGPQAPQRLPFQWLMAVPHTHVQATQADLIHLCEAKGIMPRIVKP